MDLAGIRNVSRLVRSDVQQEAERMTLTNPINEAETCAHSAVYHRISRKQNSAMSVLHCFAKL